MKGVDGADQYLANSSILRKTLVVQKISIFSDKLHLVQCILKVE